MARAELNQSIVSIALVVLMHLVAEIVTIASTASLDDSFEVAVWSELVDMHRLGMTGYSTCLLLPTIQKLALPSKVSAVDLIVDDTKC